MTSNDNKQGFKVTIVSEDAGHCAAEFELTGHHALSRFIFGMANEPFTRVTIEKSGVKVFH